MAPVIDRLRIYAGLPETLLISGPTGAGKSRLARGVHDCSGRDADTFVTVDLSTVPRDMQMAELFGWCRGAFTGASRDQAGAVTRAGGGTLFIDEIDKLSLACQAGLLRLLEERRYRTLGAAGEDLICRARMIVGTNMDLRAAVERGVFREDLYYRLNVLVTAVPGLDERRDEIPGWAAFMVARRHHEAGDFGPSRISAAACEHLAVRAWPGNLRQLDNVIRRAWAVGFASGGSTIELSDVEGALADEPGPAVGEARERVDDLLERAAEALIDEQLRCAGRRRLGLEDLDVFRGLVLDRASDRMGGLRGAFQLFGGEALVDRRNHNRAFRRASRAWLGLRAWLGHAAHGGRVGSEMSEARS